MRLLLDSHALLWWSRALPDQLSANARELIGSADTIVISVATIWEIEIKRKRADLRWVISIGPGSS